jgi:hypothetical protein
MIKRGARMVMEVREAADQSRGALRGSSWCI